MIDQFDRSKKRKILPVLASSVRSIHENSQMNLENPSFSIHTEGNVWNGETPKTKSTTDNLKLDKSEFELYKIGRRRRYCCVIWWLIALTIWILVLTIVYALHVHNHIIPSIIYYPPGTGGTIIQTCSDNSNCTGTAKYCDTNYSHQCSVCLSSDNCEDPNAKYCDPFGTRDCHQCLYDRHCGNDLVCDTEDSRKCVECMENKDCDKNPVNKLCDLTTNTCTTPCTTAICAGRTDNKTKCCGTQCIEDCPGGFACDVLKSQCVAKKPSSQKGSNVNKTIPTSSVFGTCAHCHYNDLRIAGSMFNRSLLQSMEYMTGFEYVFRITTTYPTPNIANATILYQDALNCLVSDYGKSPFIELGVYSLINTNFLEFQNILPVTSQCFFILTQGTFLSSFDCEANNLYNFQVVTYTTGVNQTAGHTPFYELYGF